MDQAEQKPIPERDFTIAEWDRFAAVLSKHLSHPLAIWYQAGSLLHQSTSEAASCNDVVNNVSLELSAFLRLFPEGNRMDALTAGLAFSRLSKTNQDLIRSTVAMTPTAPMSIEYLSKVSLSVDASKKAAAASQSVATLARLTSDVKELKFHDRETNAVKDQYEHRSDPKSNFQPPAHNKPKGRGKGRGAAPKAGSNHKAGNSATGPSRRSRGAGRAQPEDE